MLQVEKQNITTTRTLRSNTCNGKGVKKKNSCAQGHKPYKGAFKTTNSAAGH